VISSALVVLQPDGPELSRQAARQIARLLSGASPGSVPVEDPRRYQVVVNQKIARQVGVTIPPDVLREATRVIS
jgi:putative ABC transport system substrate-binding protein